jgi:hypothetical protein
MKKFEFVRRVGSNALPEKELQILIYGSADGGCWDGVVTVYAQQTGEPPLKGPKLEIFAYSV